MAESVLGSPYASITFLTYETLELAERFYGETLELRLIEDQGWAKVFRIGGTAYVGVVEARRGPIERPVGSGTLLSIVVDTIEAVDRWYARLREHGDIKLLGAPAPVPGIPVYSFFLLDPGGYRIEIQAFTDAFAVHRFRN